MKKTTNLFKLIQKTRPSYITGPTFEKGFEQLLIDNGYTKLNQVHIGPKSSKLYTFGDISYDNYSTLKELIIDKRRMTIVKLDYDKYNIVENTFMIQPFGKQQYPDFIIFIQGYALCVETKFSKTKPMWNSNIPKCEDIYIIGKPDNITFVIGSDLITQNDIDMLLDDRDDIREYVNNKNEKYINTNKPFGLYPRIAYEDYTSDYFSKIKTKREVNVINFLELLED